jgi:hypothetical protein
LDNAILNVDLDSDCFVNFLTILIHLKNGNTHHRSSLGNNHLKNFIPLIFDPKIIPDIRLRIVLYVSLILENSYPEPFIPGQQGWHLIYHLLLGDRFEITRAFAVRVIGSLMNYSIPVFNSYLMRIVFRGVVDGSHFVRFFALECINT